MKNIIGHLQSSYQFYNDENFKIIDELNKEIIKNNEKKPELINGWANIIEKSHPLYTMYSKGCYANFDYIYYTPSRLGCGSGSRWDGEVRPPHARTQT